MTIEDTRTDLYADEDTGEYQAGPEAGTAIVGSVNHGEREIRYANVDGLAIFEGDIVLGAIDQIQPLAGVKGIGRTGNVFRWPNAVVPYEVDPTLPNQQRVSDAVAHWGNHTRIRFVPRSGQTDYVRFVPSTASRSPVGRQGGSQNIELTGTAPTGTVIHEMGHAVGLWHEQSREDRNTFVEIRLATVPAENRHNFNQEINDGDDIGNYDFGSIMHYSRTAFSTSGEDTIVPRVPLPPGVIMGQRIALSQGDINAVHAMYATPDHRRVFGRDLTRNTKSIYATTRATSGNQLAQIWDDNGWHLDFPAAAAGQAGLRFTGSPAVFGRDLSRNTKSIYAITSAGQLAQIWDDNGWHLDFPAAAAGQAGLRFTGSPAVFGRDLSRNTKSIYAVTSAGQLAQIWDDNGWHLDFPAAAAGQAGLRFTGSPAVFGRDLSRNTKSIYAVTSAGQLAQIWDDNGWHLDFPAAAAGQAGLRFTGSPAVFGRDLSRNTKSIYAVTSAGQLAQIWDDNGWHLDFPAAAAGQAGLRFTGSPAVFGRDLSRNTKSIYAVTSAGQLAQIWDDNGWHLDFPAAAAGQAGLRFTGSPAVFGRDLSRNTKSIYAITSAGQLAQIWDDNGWHLDFPAAAAGHSALMFDGSI